MVSAERPLLVVVFGHYHLVLILQQVYSGLFPSLALYHKVIYIGLKFSALLLSRTQYLFYLF